MMPSLLRREKKVLTVTTSVVVLALLYHFLLDPFVREWRGLATEIRAAEAHLQKTRLLLKKKSEIEEAFRKYTGVAQEGAPAMTGILQEVEGLAQKARLQVLDMRPLPEKRKGFFQEQGLEVSAEGSAPQFAQFVYSLLESPNSLKIEKLELTSKVGQNQLLRALIVVTTLTPSVTPKK